MNIAHASFNAPVQNSLTRRISTVSAGILLAGALVVGTPTASPERTHADLSGVAAWAQTNGLSGLSPASAAPINVVASQTGVAEWAIENGLSGLSPASVGPVND